MHTEQAGKRVRRIVLSGWVCLWPALAALLLTPVVNLWVQVGVVATAGSLWAGALGLWWRRRLARYALLTSLALVGGFVLLPGRAADTEELRDAYVSAIRGFEGTRYVWGGENGRGVDCSGLVRQGMVRADLVLGAKMLNGALVREGLGIWWRDASAEELRGGYGGRTAVVMETATLNELDHSRILPGDFAVTAPAPQYHALIYVGEEKWVEADPNFMEVKRVKVPANLPWFVRPARILRWIRLEEGT